ncbi:MAG: hypothetical protein KUG61_10005 [Parvibaculaceae bacterium]|nr:hypothetical protein [Parvibaculaceae bacterium]
MPSFVPFEDNQRPYSKKQTCPIEHSTAKFRPFSARQRSIATWHVSRTLMRIGAYHRYLQYKPLGFDNAGDSSAQVLQAPSPEITPRTKRAEKGETTGARSRPYFLSLLPEPAEPNMPERPKP